MSIFRLDKYLADAGIGTRSQIKNYIKKGFVSVNSSQASKPDTKIDTDKDIITFQGETILFSKYEYYIMNKPAGYVCAAKDNLSPTVLSLINSPRKDLFTVGRLDKDTEGLLLITNDGALSHRLLSPKQHVDKTYYAILDHPASNELIDEFAKGLHIGDADIDIALPSKLVILDKPLYSDNSNILEKTSSYYKRGYVLLTIHEGKYHQVKRMFQKKGLQVLYLKRISFGSLSLPDDIPCGSWRKLTDEELSLLHSYPRENNPSQNNTLPI